MEYEQPDFTSKSPSERFVPPMLHLPQLSSLPVTPLPGEEARQFQQTPKRAQFQFITAPPHTEPLRGSSSIPNIEENGTALLPRPQLPFPMHHRAIARSLRSGVTYIPPSMKRNREMNMVDAVIACVALLLFMLLLYYYFSA